MALDARQRRLLDELLDEAAEFAERGDRARAEACLAAAERVAPDHPDVVLERLRWRLHDGDEDAHVELRALVERAPDHADALHLLGSLALDDGDQEAAAAWFSRVLRLDEAQAATQASGARADLAWIETEAERVLAELPEPFASRLAEVPVVLEARPHPGIVAEGFDPRALGLFEGGSEGSDGVAVQPTRIVLFWANLRAMCGDDAELAAEIETTLLHEIGHYFGLDEDDVEALGLG